MMVTLSTTVLCAPVSVCAQQVSMEAEQAALGGLLTDQQCNEQMKAARAQHDALGKKAAAAQQALEQQLRRAMALVAARTTGRASIDALEKGVAECKEALLALHGAAALTAPGA